MNTKITLKNIASYKEEAKLETDKKINLVYGLNGTGKTILSNYLYEKNKKDDIKTGNDYQECADNFDQNTKMLVYNERFIESILYEKMKGVFTLSSENKQAEKNIKTAESQLKIEQENQKQLNDNLNNLQKDFSQKTNHIQSKIWKIKEKYTGGDRLLDYCLEGLKGKKETLFKYLYEVSKSNNKLEETIDGLKSTLRSIKKGQTIQSIPKLELNDNTKNKSDNTPDTAEDNSNNCYDIENHSIFTEIIIGSQNSSVSQLIEQLQNSDWVRKGLKYLPKDIEEAVKCPFLSSPIARS